MQSVIKAILLLSKKLDDPKLERIFEILLLKKDDENLKNFVLGFLEKQV